MSDEVFSIETTGEAFQISSGKFSNRGYVGQVRSINRWDVGWAKAEFSTSDGRKFPEGKIYLEGDKASAETFAKQYIGLDFATAVVVISTPLASVTNLSDETKTKFKSPVLLAAARLQGLGKGEYKQPKSHNAGFNLVTAPSIVDAYARKKGWYTEPLFDVNWLGDIHNVTDTSDLLDKLAEARKAIWSALGGQDWLVNIPNDKTGEKLKEALNVVTHTFEKWARLHIVYDPSVGAIYSSKKEEKRDDPLDRNRVPVITQFFANEREAIAVGQAEIDESDSGGKAPTINWDNLSAKAKETYGDVETLRMSIPEITDALKAKAKPKVAAEYGLTVGDLGVLFG